MDDNSWIEATCPVCGWSHSLSSWLDKAGNPVPFEPGGTVFHRKMSEGDRGLKTVTQGTDPLPELAPTFGVQHDRLFRSILSRWEAGYLDTVEIVSRLEPILEERDSQERAMDAISIETRERRVEREDEEIEEIETSRDDIDL